MDKREVLRRLDRLNFEMDIKEDELRKLYNKWNNVIPVYYSFYGKMSGVEWAKRELEKVRSAIAHTDEPPEVTEMCPSCGKEVTLIWDTEKDGYKAFCPYCGEWLMLCSACHDDGFACDYSKDTDSEMAADPGNSRESSAYVHPQKRGKRGDRAYQAAKAMQGKQLF